jgi:hypothetical protein
MSARKSIVALAATTVIALAASTPNVASAHGGHGHGGHGHGHGFHGGHFGHFRFAHRGYHRFGHYRFAHYHWWGRYHGRYWVGYKRPYYYYGVVGAPSDGGPAPQASDDCLIKRYLPNGNVLFEDVCTKEEAVAPPQAGLQAPAQLPGGSR